MHRDVCWYCPREHEWGPGDTVEEPWGEKKFCCSVSAVHHQSGTKRENTGRESSNSRSFSSQSGLNGCNLGASFASVRHFSWLLSMSISCTALSSTDYIQNHIMKRHNIHQQAKQTGCKLHMFSCCVQGSSCGDDHCIEDLLQLHWN